MKRNKTFWDVLYYRPFPAICIGFMLTTGCLLLVREFIKIDSEDEEK